MEIKYSSQAKDDLARIDWRIRESLINTIQSQADSENSVSLLEDLGENNLHKISVGDYATLGKLENNVFLVLSVIKKQTIKLPHE